MGARLAVLAFWLLHWLPFRLQSMLGGVIGRAFYAISARRRNVVMVNLRLCFPAFSDAERVALAKAHFMSLGRSAVERGILLWAPESRIRRWMKLEGAEHLEALAGTPLIVMAPHFVGLDVGWTRLTCDYPMAGMYARQKNDYFDAVLFKGRTRFKVTYRLTRQDGIRSAVRALKQGMPFYYLPDMDYGERDTIFVPFFGNQTATITGLSRLSRVSGAKVVPCVTRMLEDGKGYVVKLYPPWDNFPGESVEADTRRMNAFIEDRIMEMPEQYYWVHRRFKTRPEGEERPY
jgi:Kdo2-lipid IVA lauroyltransferase/acyltransferase